MNLFRSFSTIILTIILIFAQSGVSVIAAAAPSKIAQLRQTEKKPSEVNKPAAASPVLRASKKWSDYDWDEKQALPRDIENYLRELDKLEEAGDREGIANLTPKKSRLSDDDVMDYYRVPQEVKQIVKEAKNKSVKDKPNKKPERDVELSEDEEQDLKDKLSRVKTVEKGKEKRNKLSSDENLPRIKADKVKRIPKGKLKKNRENEEQATNGLEEEPQATENKAKQERHKKGVLGL